MRRPIARRLIAAAVFAAVPAVADAAGPRAHGRHGGTSVSVVVTTGSHAVRPSYHRPVMRWRPSPARYRIRPYVYRPVIFVPPRPVIYAPPPVVYAAPAARPIQTAAEPERYCREYQTTVTVGGHTEQAYGTACREADGSWVKID